MGIGRREFLKLMGVALAGLSIDPLEAIAVNEDYYINKKLGIALEKPNNWYFISIKSFEKMKNEQILPIEDKALEVEIREMMDDPILLIAKYPVEMQQDIFSPAIAIHLEHFILEEDTLLDTSYKAAKGFKLFLTDYNLIEDPKPLQLSKCDSVEMNARFTYTHKRLQPTPVEVRTYLIYQNPILYTLHMFDSEFLNDTTQEEFDFFITHFKLI